MALDPVGSKIPESPSCFTDGHFTPDDNLVIKAEPEEFDEATESFLYPSVGIKEELDCSLLNDVLRNADGFALPPLGPDLFTNDPSCGVKKEEPLANKRRRKLKQKKPGETSDAPLAKPRKPRSKKNVQDKLLRAEAIERIRKCSVRLERLSESLVADLSERVVNEKITDDDYFNPASSPDTDSDVRGGDELVVRPLSKKSRLTKSKYVKPRIKVQSRECKDCGEIFKTKSQIKTHRHEMHPKEDGVAVGTTCDQCGKIFSRSSGLKYHMAHVHADESEKKDLERKFECETCGKKFFKRSHLTFHNQVHTGVKLFTCRKGCGKGFNGSSGRKAHEEKCDGQPKEEVTHNSTLDFTTGKIVASRKGSGQARARHYLKSENTLSRPRNHGDSETGSTTESCKRRTCQFCGKEFKLPSQCVRHERVHTGEKWFKCTYENCTKEFAQLVSLRDHISASHTGESLTCPHEGCGQKFSRSLNLKYHIKVKHEKPSFVCGICGAQFATKPNLARHELIHKGVKPFVCQTCGMAFRLNYKLTKHMKIHLKPLSEQRRRRPVDPDRPVRTRNRKPKKEPSANDEPKRIYSYDKYFFCQIDKCGKGFATKRSMVVHIKNHHGPETVSTAPFSYIDKPGTPEASALLHHKHRRRRRSNVQKKEPHDAFQVPMQPAAYQSQLQLPQPPQFVYSQPQAFPPSWQQNHFHGTPPLQPAFGPVASVYQSNSNQTQIPVPHWTNASTAYSESGSAVSDVGGAYSGANSTDGWDDASHHDNDGFHSADYSPSDDEPEIITNPNTSQSQMPTNSTPTTSSPVKMAKSYIPIPTLPSASLDKGDQRFKPKRYFCFVCNRRYATELALSIHKQIHKEAPELPEQSTSNANNAKEIVSDIVRRNRHKQRQAKGSVEHIHSCDICGKTFPRPHLLYRHQMTHDPGLHPYKCRFCDGAFKDVASLRSHSLINHPDVSREFKCDLCGKSYSTKGYLYVHKKQVHAMTTQELWKQDNPATQCTICGKECSRTADLRRHMILHDPEYAESLFKCKQPGCEEKFTSGSAVKKHVFEKHPDANFYQCDQCEMKLISERSLNYHKLKHHSNFQGFNCTYDGCGKSFQSGQSMKYHIETVHLTEEGKVVQCPHCPREFKSRRQMFEHLRRGPHRPSSRPRHPKGLNKPLFNTCEICERNFERPWALRRHMLTHSEERAFKCPEEGCDKAFFRRDAYNRHLKVKHVKKEQELIELDPSSDKSDCEMVPE